MQSVFADVSGEEAAKLGESNLQLGRIGEAIANFKEVARLRPWDAKIHHKIGLLYKKLGRPREAMDEFQKAVHLDPKDGQLRLDLAIEKVVLNPADAKAHFDLAMTYFEQDAGSGALWGHIYPEFKEALRLDPANADFHYWLGVALKQYNTFESAAAEWEESFRLNPANIPLLVDVGKLYVTRSNRQKAVDTFKEVLRHDPDNVDARRYLAELAVTFQKNHYDLGARYAADGLWTKAIEAFTASIAEQETALAHFQLSKAYAHQGLWKKALHEYKTALDMDPALAQHDVPKEWYLWSANLFLLVLCLTLYFRHKYPVSRLWGRKKADDGTAYRPDIDGLRAIAVLSVVAFHANMRGAPGGFTGVDVFFVISGYLISGIIFKGVESGSFTFRDFYGRRIKRIFPAFIIVLLAVWVAGWFVLSINEYRMLGKHIAAGAVFATNFALWQEAGYFDTAANLKPLLHLWSLGVEEQYYLLWPPLLYLAWRWKTGPLTFLCLLGAGSFAINVWQTPDNTVMAFFLPHTRIWELMLGGFLAWTELFATAPQAAGEPIVRPGLFSSGTFLGKARPVAAWCGLLLIVGSVAGLERSHPYPGWRAMLPAGGAFLLIAAGRDTWLNKNILANRALVYVGLISYPLYLWHWPLLSFSRILLANEPGEAIKVFLVVLALALSWLTYQFIEKPIRFGNSPRVKFFVPVLASLVFCLGLSGFVTFKTDGFAWRFPQYLQRTAEVERLAAAANKDKPVCGEKSGSACAEANSPAKKGPVFVVWGDSTAQALYPAFQALIKKRGGELRQGRRNRLRDVTWR